MTTPRPAVRSTSRDVAVLLVTALPELDDTSLPLEEKSTRAALSCDALTPL